MLTFAVFIANAALVLSATSDLPPSCSKPVFCDSNLLHLVQTNKLYEDSKTFVDLELKQDPNTTLANFQTLLDQNGGNLSKDQISKFVNESFTQVSVLDEWAPPDYDPEPPFLLRIRDQDLRKFAKDINDIWLKLGRKVKQDVFDNPDRYSLVPISHGFIIPGGRFTEIYYWDTYWIIEGLLICGMRDTARGMIQNLLELLKQFGHIPNGSRWYYQERSQPPLLSAMMALYWRETKDITFIKENIDLMESEIRYWLDTHTVTFDKNGRTYTLLRYYAPSDGPRPESYYEDYMTAQAFETDERKTEFYTEIKSAAESGWDFSSRWFIDQKGANSGNLTMIHTTDLIPVDLNAMFANTVQNVAYFRALLRQPRHAAHWAFLAKQWRNSIDEVLWDEQKGMWFDYDMRNEQFREYFYASNAAPLWMGVVNRRLVRKRANKILNYLKESHGLDYPGGIPVSLNFTGEQWDFPNAWPPVVSIMINAIDALGTSEARQMAFHLAQTWVRANYKGFSKYKMMFEKYSVQNPGEFGYGGEYTVQEGFGWANGCVLEFIAKYGRSLTASDSLQKELSSSSSESKTDSEDDSSSEELADAFIYKV